MRNNFRVWELKKRIAIELNIEEKLKKVKKNIAIQGEIIGPAIQGNKYKLNKLDLYIFNVYDINKKQYYTIDNLIKFCNDYGFKHVPLIELDFKLFNSVPEMVEYSKGCSILNNKTMREGIVVRSIEKDKFISFKVINPEFLLKNEL
jgi:ATP-dependent RNA circularization protein (DNA/RNA ligase family)